MSRGRQSRISREAWSLAALKAMRSGGVRAVRVEPIARKLGVTKGSFYWHFTDRDELVGAALSLWEERGTTSVIEKASRVADPVERVLSLFGMAFAERGGGVLLVHLAGDAENPLVAPILERITRRRLEFIGKQFEALGLGSDEAHRRALLCYSAYAGTFTLDASVPGSVPDGAERHAYLDHLVRTLVPGD